ncbi:hypothetical protein O181_113944 [Austropuccinia psidii MF-1]|uniref:Integrase zinc-binding domain-containing protein n=1 Tax=Austropuccinia psidii MF-1 TaxID=1389203 RepID=A0A9Q3K4G8_9BASI|nr:hypothetical protein [Austropuccinia psidii MF-1]
MTIVHKYCNIDKNEDGLSRWPLPNDINNPAYVPEEASAQIPIEEISVTDLNTTFVEEMRYGENHMIKEDSTYWMVYSLANLLLQECHDSPFSGHLSEDRTREKVKTFIWWPMWKKYFSEYFKTCYRCQKENKSTGKRLGNMIKIQEPSGPWKIVHMDWVTGLSPGGDKSYNAFLVIVESFSKTPIFLQCQKDDTDMDKALLLWNRVV